MIVLIFDCDLIQLPNGKWWCPAPGCDDEKKRLLPGDYRRNCRSPERNEEAKKRWQESEKKLVVCRACPIGMWDDEDDYCQKYSGNACRFSRKLANPSFRCKFWPEVLTVERGQRENLE